MISLTRTAPQFNSALLSGLGAFAAVLFSLALLFWMAFGPLGLGLAKVTLLILLLAAGFIISLRWRLGVYFVLIYVTVEGLVANILFPSALPLLFKDFLIAAVYLGCFSPLLLRQQKLSLPGTIVFPVLALSILAGVQSLNPATGGLGVALIGARVLLFYIPLWLVGYQLARRENSLDDIVRFVLVTSLPVALYGFYQYSVGPDAIIALGEGFARTVWISGAEATQDLIYRPTSTFSFVGHFGAYLLFIAILAFAVLHQRGRWRERPLYWVSLAITLVVVVIQAQRTTWVLLPVAVGFIYLLNRHPQAVVRGAPILALAVTLAISLGGPVLENRLPLLTEGTKIYSERLRSSTIGRYQESSIGEALVGHGTGTALGAIRHLSNADAPDAFESGWFQPFYMFGVWGVLAYLWLYAAVLRCAWGGVKGVPAGQRWLPTAIFVYLALTAVVNGPINYPPTNVYFWLFAGLLAGLCRSPSSPESAEPIITKTQPSGARQ